MRTRSLYHLSAFVFFLCLAIWLTWPQAMVLGNAIVGGPIAEADGWQKVWNLWWVRFALTEGHDPFYTHMLYWPQGAALGFQPIDITNAFLTLPVLFATGPIAAYGVAAILGFALSGWFAYLLALRVTDSLPGAFAAGMVIAAAPQHMMHFVDGQIEHVALQWAVLYVLVLVHATQRPSWRNGVWLAASIALVAYTNFYHALFVSLMTAVWVLYHALAKRQIWPLLRPWVVMVPVTLLLMLPLIPSTVAGMQQSVREPDHWLAQAHFFRADLVDLVLPSAYHPIWGEAVYSYQHTIHPKGASWVVTPGYLTLFLMVVGMRFAWRETRVYALLVGLFLLYALGPTLSIHGVDTGIPLPLKLISSLPLVNLGYRRTLALLIGLIPLAVVVAFGVRVLCTQVQGRQKLIVLSSLFALWLIEIAPPNMLVLHDDTSPLYRDIGTRSGALLEVPIDSGKLEWKSAGLRAQMTHQRPLFGGYVARRPDYSLFKGAPLISELRHLRCERTDIVSNDSVTARAALAHYATTDVMLHADRLSESKLDCARSLLEDVVGLSPSRTMGAVTLYHVPTFQPHSFVFVGDGWHRVETNHDKTWRWMKETGQIYVVNADDQPRSFAIRLRMESFARPRNVMFAIDEHAMGEMRVASSYAREYRIPVTVAPGQHTIHLTTTTDEDPGPEGVRRISISVQSLTIEPLERGQ